MTATTSPQDHELFRRFPLASRIQTSCGLLPNPYHIYDGCALFMGGTADLGAVRQLLASERVRPIETTTGQALMGIWVIDATAASLGTHQELQFSLFVSRRSGHVVPPHPLGLLKLLLFDPDVRILCHGLWNTTPEVVAFNREVLGLNANLMTGIIQQGGGKTTFSFTEEETNNRIFSGDVPIEKTTSGRVTGSLIRLIGLRGMVRMLNQPYLAAQVMNPIGPVIPHHAEAQAYIQSQREILQFFTESTGTLEFGDTPYRDLKFQPQFVEQMIGFKFAYLNPYNAGESGP